ncbi:MAG TPA: LLM class flavin-dependent oxidoreductase [Ktedonobacteraceae bacterium]|jgi:alkanesulfonate monooxygenase SsuD/methylene tetrahydromethanopterin reductase-like flavin-dependent oxidoreductase (luciferase family)
MNVRFSLFYNFDILPGKSVVEMYREVEAQALLADTLGFDAIWLAEHHFALYGRMPDPLLFLSRIGALTKQIGLGTAVVEAPHYHPLRLAEDAALLDVLSHGRVRLGVGSGAANKPAEFARFGIPIEQKSARTFEITEILRQAFADGHVNFAGQYYQYEDVEISPRPIQAAAQLLWLAAGTGTPELAGKFGFRLLIPRIGPTSRHQQQAVRYREALAGKSGFVSALRFVYVAETEQEAQTQTRHTITRYAKYDCGLDWDGRTDTQEYFDLLRRLNAVIGTPDQVIAQLRAWQQEIAFEEIMCQTYAAGMSHEDSLRSIHLLGSEVLPHLQTNLSQ